MPRTERFIFVFDARKRLRVDWAIAPVLMLVFFFWFTWAPLASAAEGSLPLLAISRTTEQPDPGFRAMKFKVAGATETLQVEIKPVLTEKHVAKAWVHEQGTVGVLVEMNPEGRQLLFDLTREQLGRRLAFLAQGRLMMAPVVREPITSGQVILSGGIDRDWAERFVASLEGLEGGRAAAAPAASAPAASWLSDHPHLIENDYRQLAAQLFQRAAQDYERWLQLGRPIDFHNAQFNINSALEIDPDASEYWFFQGMLHAALKADPLSLALATDSFLSALDLQPDHRRARFALAQVLQEQGKFRLAADQYQVLLDAHPEMITGLVLGPLALCYLLGDNPQDGVVYLQGLSVRYPDSAPLRLALAVLLRNNNREASARKELEQVINGGLGVEAEQEYARLLLAQWGQGGSR